jgi:putative methyltransferase (TIGR04325 family)
MRILLADYIPPILIKKLLPVVRKIKLGGARIESYQDSDLVKIILFKNLQLRQTAVLTNLDAMSFRTIAAVGMAIENKYNFTVLDFGGGAGHHQLLAKKSFKNVNFDWTVVETEAMSRTAQEVIKDEGLKFISSLSTLTKEDKFDLIFSNSAIQYTQEPLKTLRKLLNLEFGHFFITRVPLNLENNQISYLQESLLSQNGPGPAPKDFQDKWVKYENNIVSKESFEELLSEALESWTSVDEGTWDPGRFGDRVRTYSYFGSAKNGINQR